MLAGSREPFCGPNRAAPVEPGHRGQLARLIREAPVFVNVARCRISRSSKRRNLREYSGFRRVLWAGWRFIPQPLDDGNRRTLAIRNLTAAGAKRILKPRGAEAYIVSVTDEQPTQGKPRPK